MMIGTDIYQIECTKRDIGHLCTKDERHPRAKRARMGPSHKEYVESSWWQLHIVDFY